VPDIICTEFSGVKVDFKIVRFDHFAFVINVPCTGSDESMVTGTSYQLVHLNSDKIDDIATRQLNVKSNFQIDHNPYFVTIESIAHCKTKVIILSDYEN